MNPSGDDPVAQYKETLTAAREAAARSSERERRRATELANEIAEAERAITAAADEEQQVSQEIHAWWRRVAATVADVKWLSAGRRPAPDPAARPERLAEYLGEIEPATDALKSALRKASWPLRPN